MVIREVTIDDYKDIRNLNKNALGYDFPLEKQKHSWKNFDRQGS